MNAPASNRRAGWASPPILRRLVSVSVVAMLAVAWSGPAVAAPPVARTQALVTLRASQTARSAPHAGAAAVASIPAQRPITGTQTVLPVLAHATGGWLQVRLPGRPNGRTGWIRTQTTSSSVTPWHIVVKTGQRRVVVFRAGRVVKWFRAVVGKPSTPTPLGTFFVEEPVRLAAWDSGAPYALALSARSNVLQEFEGGPGQIALHGLLNVGGVPGTAVSHGCIRLETDAMNWLVSRIGAGVPVTITA